MKKSKILKILSYILIPIFILILGISIFYEVCKEKYINSVWDDKMYFQSDDFVWAYMKELSSETYNLIYKNSKYNHIEDGENIIYYNEKQSINDIKVENFYYIIIYRNKAYTNVELTALTNTIDSIKEYIEKNSYEKGKYANLIKGEVSSNSNIISNKAIKYFNLFENTYYTTEKYLEEENEGIHDIIEVNGESPKIYNIYTEKIEDLIIYSSYKEHVSENEYSLFYKDIITKLSNFEKLFFISIPIVSILLILSIFYLIISIGYNDESNKIELNDIDKIPIEIITIIIFSINGALCYAIYKLYNNINQENSFGIISLFFAIYFTIYILSVIWSTSFIKRIKAKILIKKSILVILISIIIKIIGKFIKFIASKLKKKYFRIRKQISLYTKIIGIIIIYLIIAYAVLSFFKENGIVINILIAIILMYPIILDITNYKRIEKRIEKIYKGDYSEKLDEDEFSTVFHNIINNINNISSGFEKAIGEGVKAERLKTELITNVSHDLKTPLTSIINYVDLLKKEDIENEKAKEYLEILDNKAQRLKKLTEDLIEASKASSGNIKLNFERINICELIRQASGEFEDKFNNNKLEIYFDFPEKDVYIKADNRYIYRVIENLYSNITKYALSNSRVYVDIKRFDNKVKIILKNISKEKLNISAEELTQRFIRGDKSRSTEGSGLGLAISKSLTEIQKGKFNLQIDGDLFKVELEFNII